LSWTYAYRFGNLRRQGAKNEVYEDDSFGYAKDLSYNPAYFSLGLSVGPIASGENTLCRRDLDQSMQDAKVLANWYSRFGIETREYKGGYYGKLDTAAGLFAFGIHPKKADAPTKCSASVSVVYRVENFEGSLEALKSKGLLPDKIEKDPDQGQFAHFHDPDGNEVTIWGK